MPEIYAGAMDDKSVNINGIQMVYYDYDLLTNIMNGILWMVIVAVLLGRMVGTQGYIVYALMENGP